MANWIKCSERMPEKYKTILVHNRFGEMRLACLSFRNEFWCDNLEVDEVTHWQPLPEPLQE